MAGAATLSLSPNPSFTTSSSHKPSLSTPNFLKFPTLSPIPIKPLTHAPQSQIPISRATFTTRAAASPTPSTTFHGLCYVVGDNIDTDQIIPAEYLTLVPSNPSEYEKLGSYALCGLPGSYSMRFVDPGETRSKYSIIIEGANFGYRPARVGPGIRGISGSGRVSGSSREHAPVALGAAGVAAVVAESYARIFFRNSVATGEVYPLESEGKVCEECKTGDVVSIELSESRLINHTTGKEYTLKPIGDAGPVIRAGGIFAYAREAGMIPTLTC